MPIFLNMEFTEPRPLYGGGEIPLVMDVSFKVSPEGPVMTFSEMIPLKITRKFFHFYRNLNS